MMLEYVGGLSLDPHGISGMIAIILMVIHATWALAALLRKDEKTITKFHTFSVFVWAVWLIPFFSPMFFAMTR